MILNIFHLIKERRQLFKFNNTYGFTIIEMVITIALLSFGIIGVYNFFQPAIILSSNFSNYSIATYLSEEAIEIVGNIRDNNVISGQLWSQSFEVCGSGCELDYKTGTSLQGGNNILRPYEDAFLNINEDGFYGYDIGSETIFKRKVTINELPSDSNVLKIDSLVIWESNGQDFSLGTVEYIYNY